MSVEPETARAQGLVSEHEGTTYYFCGKGCKLDFDETPQTYLDPALQAVHVGHGRSKDVHPDHCATCCCDEHCCGCGTQ